MWRSIFRPVSMVAVAAVLALAGCGSDDQTTSAGAQQTAATTAAPATTTTVAPSTTVTSTSAQRCTNVSFSSNPEDIASDIRSTGLTCTEAEAFVRKVGTQLSSPTGPPRVEAEGFVCNRTSVRSGDHGPALGTFDCTSGAIKVTFVRALVD